MDFGFGSGVRELQIESADAAGGGALDFEFESATGAGVIAGLYGADGTKR